MLEYIAIIIAVGVFGLQHSGLSALRVKHHIINRWGKQGYSRIFTSTSILTLIPVVLVLNFWDWLYFLSNPQLFTLTSVGVGLCLALIGVWIAIKAIQVIDVSTVSDMRTDRKPELITIGVYSRVRHPLYFALVLLFTGLVLIYPFPQIITFSVSFIIYVLIGTYLEEKKLILQYGNEYLEYKKQAGFMIPKV